MFSQARWFQKAEEGGFDIEDGGDDDAFLSSADDGPPGMQLQHSLVYTFCIADLPVQLPLRTALCSSPAFGSLHAMLSFCPRATSHPCTRAQVGCNAFCIHVHGVYASA